MRRPTKMLLMTSRKDRDYDRKEAGGRDYENRPRESSGTFREPEDRFRDRRGREHYDNGRFAPARNEGGGIYGSRYPREPYYPPIYQRGGEGGSAMNRIGFAVSGEAEHLPDQYRQREFAEEAQESDEIAPRRGSRRMGFAAGQEDGVSQEEAQEWARGMENEDGTTGPHWTMEQTKQVQAQNGIDCDPVEFYLAMNMMYSDYMKAAKKLGVNKVDFYACMAKAFLDDKDAGPDKLRRYFHYVVGV